MQFLGLSLIWWIFIATVRSQLDLFGESDINLFPDVGLGPELWPENVASTNPLDQAIESDWNSFLEHHSPNLAFGDVPDGNWMTELDDPLLRDDVDGNWMAASDGILLSETIDGNSEAGSDLFSLLPGAESASLFSDDAADWDAMIDSDPSFFLADDGTACDVSDADDLDLFGKKRRQVCKDPATGQTGFGKNPGGGKKKNITPVKPPERSQNPGWEPTFMQMDDVCPPSIFRKSNVPACKEFFPPPDEIYVIFGQEWAHLYDVTPGTSCGSSASVLIMKRI
jgi:hypothetical protein